nr:MAG TPA: hypothetical protein [Caudoviricetes sp.]
MLHNTLPNITNHIINIHITNTILKAFRGCWD